MDLTKHVPAVPADLTHLFPLPDRSTPHGVARIDGPAVAALCLWDRGALCDRVLTHLAALLTHHLPAGEARQVARHIVEGRLPDGLVHKAKTHAVACGLARDPFREALGDALLWAAKAVVHLRVLEHHKASVALARAIDSFTAACPGDAGTLVEIFKEEV